MIPSSIAYECISAIGNSLILEEMLTEVISTFVHHTGSVGGKYIVISPEIKSILNIGNDFEIPKILSKNSDGFEIHLIHIGSYLLDIPIGNDHFIFCFKENDNIEMFGTMISSFRTKLANSINACRSVEELNTLNLRLTGQIVEEKHKNALTEKLMISQSRMAIMGEMIGMIAHQWRQPITIIGMITNNVMMDMQMDDLDISRLSKDLELVDKQVHYLSQTIDDFRNFFRPNKRPQRITFGELSNELTTILGKSFETHRILLVFKGDSSSTFITYKNELLQVFLNMMSNSKDAFVEANKGEGEITLVSSFSDASVTFTVHDSAGGIPASIIDRIFEPYFSTKNELNGTGLGLYMSATIIEKHLKGSICVSSDTSGTTFTIILPIQITEEDYNVY